MNLIKFDESHLAELMTWFPTQKSASTWGGPDFRFPFTGPSFMNDLNLRSTNSFVLVNDSLRPVAFGQYYLRNQRCHLSRLAVSPAQRGGGIGSDLIAQLSARGQIELMVTSCSLFVMADNKPAKRLYLSLGFIEAEYPQEIEADMIYMIKKVVERP